MTRRQAVGAAACSGESRGRSVFQKLDIHDSPLANRRVLAVLAYLRSRQ